MAMVWNPTNELVSTKMQGSWFTFKPDAKKQMDDSKCRFIEEMRKDTGLVVLPPEFDPMYEGYDPAYEKSDEAKKILEDLKSRGISNMLSHHYNVIKNNQVSLRRDMAHKYPDGDSKRLTALEMSSGELESLKLVSKYQGARQDTNEKKIKEVEKLLSAIGPVGE